MDVERNVQGYGSRRELRTEKNLGYNWKDLRRDKIISRNDRKWNLDY